MTTSYKEAFGIVSFETDPQTDINADAKCWHPASNEWVDCPGPTAMGVDVLWSVDYTQIPAASVPEMQQRCRDLSNVRRRGDTENWPPRRPLRHERGWARSPKTGPRLAGAPDGRSANRPSLRLFHRPI
jgi:hypothetical protein